MSATAAVFLFCLICSGIVEENDKSEPISYRKKVRITGVKPAETSDAFYMYEIRLGEQDYMMKESCLLLRSSASASAKSSVMRFHALVKMFIINTLRKYGL